MSKSFVTSYQSMEGVDRVATLLLALPDDRANDLLGRFSFEEVQQISHAMVKLEKISPSVVEQVLYEFMRTMYVVPPLKGSFERTEKILANILPEEEMLSLRLHSRSEKTLWQDIPNLPSSFFVKHLKKESNQTIAIILKNIPDYVYVAKLLALLPSETAIDVTYRMINLPEVDPAILHHLEQALLPIMMTTGEKDRYASVAELLGSMPRSQEKMIIDGLNVLHAPTVNRIRQILFNFERIVSIDDAGIRILIKSFDKARMAIALKGVEETILNRFMSNMSARAGKFLQDEIDALTGLSQEEIEKAQVELAQVAKQLIREGEIKRPPVDASSHESETQA